MTTWDGFCGLPWAGSGWIYPVLCLLFMAAMAFLCFRLARRCMAGTGGRATPEVDEFRREIRELREEVQKLRQRS